VQKACGSEGELKVTNQPTGQFVASAEQFGNFNFMMSSVESGEVNYNRNTVHFMAERSEGEIDAADAKNPLKKDHKRKKIQHGSYTGLF
jgi:hypothetical protein